VIKIYTYVSRKTSLYVVVVGLVLSLGLYYAFFMQDHSEDSAISISENAFQKLESPLVKQPVYISWNGDTETTMRIQKEEKDLLKDVLLPVPALSTDTVSSPGAVEQSVDESPEEPARPTSAVLSKSGITKEHIADMLKGTALSGQALEDPILEVEDEYGINAYFTIAVMKLESGNGTSRLSKEKNNLFGLNAIDGYENELALRFRTKADCVREFGDIIKRIYLEKGYTTVERVAKKYCPANPKWPTLVKNIMNRDYQKYVM
jgi:flagellum-specific peptidoglycan hydrolase FlgJ